MAFARVKALGWAFGEILTSGQMTTLDADHANAVDGAGGGTYGGPLTFSNLTSITTTGNATVGGALAVTGNGTISGNGTVGGTLGVTGHVTIATNVAVGADFSVGNNSTLLGDLDVQGDTTLEGTTDQQGATTFHAPFGPTASALGVLNLGLGPATDTDATYSVSGRQCLIMPLGVLTADRSYNIVTSGLRPGTWVRAATYETAHALLLRTPLGVALKDPGGNNLTLKYGAAGFYDWVDIVLDAAGTVWLWAGGFRN